MQQEESAKTDGKRIKRLRLRRRCDMMQCDLYDNIAYIERRNRL